MQGDFQVGEFLVQPLLNSIRGPSQEVHVEPKVMEVLVYLAKHPGEVLLKERIIQAVWADSFVTDDVLKHAISELRKAFGDQATDPRLIQTVHRRGYRLIAPVLHDLASNSEDEGASSEPSARWSKRLRRRHKVAIGVLAALGLAGLVIGFDELRDFLSSAVHPSPVSLAVLPLDNLANDPDQDYLVEGLHEDLITYLSKARGLLVTSRRSASLYRKSPKSVREIAQELNVDAVVEGSVLLLDGEVRITVQLIDGRTDKHLWAGSYDRDMRDVLSMLSEVAQKVTGEIRVVMTPQEEESLAYAPPVDPEAYKAYLKGRHLFNNTFSPRGSRESIRHFQKAIDIDQNFALAWAGLAGAHAVNAYIGGVPPAEGLSQAKAAALKAVELDDGISLGHAILGYIGLFEWDWQAAGRFFKKALDLNPADHPAPFGAYHGYGDYLTIIGRAEEGLAYVKEGRDRDPLSATAHMTVLGHLYVTRRYEQTIMEARKLLKLLDDYKPFFAEHREISLAGKGADCWAYQALGMGYWQQGKRAQALLEFGNALRCDPETAELAEALEQTPADSKPQAAVAAVARRLSRRAESNYVDPYRIALWYARAGQIEEAFEWLERAYQDRSPALWHFKVFPEFDPLRADRRFADMLLRMGLEP